MAKGREKHQARQNELNLLGKSLAKRAKSKCELCSQSGSLHIYEVPPLEKEPDLDHCLLLCDECQNQINHPKQLNAHHWHCLYETMWSDVPSIKVLVWRILKVLGSNEAWAYDLLDQMYLDEEQQAWAEAESL